MHYQYSNTEKKPIIISTNQQCFATVNPEFSGLTQAAFYKINKSTGKRAIEPQRFGAIPKQGSATTN